MAINMKLIIIEDSLITISVGFYHMNAINWELTNISFFLKPSNISKDFLATKITNSYQLTLAMSRGILEG